MIPTTLRRVYQPHMFAAQTLPVSISVSFVCTVPTRDDDGICGFSKRSAVHAFPLHVASPPLLRTLGRFPRHGRYKRKVRGARVEGSGRTWSKAVQAVTKHKLHKANSTRNAWGARGKKRHSLSTRRPCAESFWHVRPKKEIQENGR